MSFKKDGRKFKFTSNEFTIAIGSDWHVGAPGCILDLISRQIKYVKTHENCYFIGAGDLLECAIYGSKGSVHEQKYMMSDQYKIVKGLLSQIKDKILFMLSGNHSARIEKATTLDLMEVLCNDLGVDYYGPEYNFALQCKRGSIIEAYCGHNSGGGGTAGSKINRLIGIKSRATAMCDLIISGHTHDVADTEMPIYYFNKNYELVKKIQHFVCGWSALSSECGYAAKGYFRPLTNGQKLVHIKINRTTESFDINIEKLR